MSLPFRSHLCAPFCLQTKTALRGVSEGHRQYGRLEKLKLLASSRLHEPFDYKPIIPPSNLQVELAIIAVWQTMHAVF